MTSNDFGKVSDPVPVSQFHILRLRLDLEAGSFKRNVKFTELVIMITKKIKL